MRLIASVIDFKIGEYLLIASNREGYIHLVSFKDGIVLNNMTLSQEKALSLANHLLYALEIETRGGRPEGA